MPRRRDVDRLESIQELIEDLWQVPRFARGQASRPNVDCYRVREPARLVVVAELPGVEPGDVKIEVGERALTISGTRRRPPVEGEASYQQLEIEYGPFQRRIGLCETVRAEGAEASFERGILTVTLPVVEREPEPEPTIYTIAVTVLR